MGLGFVTDVAVTAARLPWLGDTGYAAGVLHRVLGLKPHRLTLAVDGQSVMADNCGLGIVVKVLEGLDNARLGAVMGFGGVFLTHDDDFRRRAPVDAYGVRLETSRSLTGLSNVFHPCRTPAGMK